nr:MAG TPA: hypothetical protein [Caudoviricetes sp.]
MPHRIYFGRHPSQELPDLLRAVGLPRFSYDERSTIKQRIWYGVEESNPLAPSRCFMPIV